MSASQSTSKRVPSRSVTGLAFGRVIPAGITMKFAKRQAVFHSGEPASRFYEVLDGTLMLFTVLPDGRRQILEIIPRGWVCGFATDGAYDGSCEALTDATLMSYSRAEMEADDPVRSRLLHRAEDQLCVLHDQALTLGRKDAEERLATFLMRFLPGKAIQHCRNLKGPSAKSLVHIPMSRTEIADYLGLTVETVSRTITALADKGIVQVGSRRGDMFVNDICQLCLLARNCSEETDP